MSIGISKSQVTSNKKSSGSSAALVTVAFSTTPTFDASLGNGFKITLTGNVSSATFSNGVAGTIYTFQIIQDGTGGRTFVWPTNIIGGMNLTAAGLPSIAASAIVVQSFFYDGTNAYAISAGTIS